MKAKGLLILSLLALVLSSCTREVVHQHRYSSADLYFDYWSGPSGTIIEGDIFNDGERYIGSVELEVRLFDDGSLISRDYFWIDSYTYPGEDSYFTLNLDEPYIDDVSVRIISYD